MTDVLDRLREQFSPSRIAHHVVTEVLPDVLVAALTLAAFYLLWLVLHRALRVLARAHLDETARAFITQLVKYAVFTLGAVSALSQLGVNTASLVTSVGVAGLTLGFAARDTLSNVISGLFIFWDRPFVVGDLIEIGGHYGRVSEITMRSTRVVTVDGRMVAIPNAEVANSAVASYTNFPHLRLDIDFTVATTEDLGRVRKLALACVEGDERFMSDPEAEVVVTKLNDYNVAMQLRVWLRDERTHVSVRLELREALFLALRAADVDMPLETLALAPLRVTSTAA
jgi:small conductance mechanosensitive channel